MDRLINIVLYFKEYVVLALLIIISIVLLSFNDNTQIRAIRSYTVGAIGFLQNALTIIPNVVELKRENEVLRQLNVNLSNEVSLLREARLENLKLRGLAGLKQHSPFKLVAGNVVGKSLLLMRNTITLDIGEAEGVKTDMAVISESGLVGKIIATSEKYSIAQLVLNKDFRASAKIQRTRIDGILAWDGGEVLHLKNVSKTQDVKEGDLVITSEYSSVFPSEVKIGIVSRLSEKPGSLFKEVEVTSTVDFPSLEQVFVVAAAQDPERKDLEKKATRTK
ncbi:MAG TPA: rod shape-determining protein MreC [Bacteroidota bacterium]|jgi:rod shape-determining protein MreC